MSSAAKPIDSKRDAWCLHGERAYQQDVFRLQKRRGMFPRDGQQARKAAVEGLR